MQNYVIELFNETGELDSVTVEANSLDEALREAARTFARRSSAQAYEVETYEDGADIEIDGEWYYMIEI